MNGSGYSFFTFLERERLPILRVNFPRAIKVEDTADMYIENNAYVGERVVVNTRIAFYNGIAVIVIAVCNLFYDTLKFVYRGKYILLRR